MSDEAFNGSATDHTPARISVTYMGYEVWCDKCGKVASVPTQVEGTAKAKEHQKAHPL